MRILIVEDDADFRETLKNVLKAEGFVVDTASDGESGSYIARTHSYSLIILDYILPYKNGEQVCKEIRAAGSSVPVIISSVRTEVDDKISLLNSGADDYICKPYALGELVARIRALIKRPYKIVDSILRLDDLTIDTSSQEVTRSGERIYLTRKEYMLLECMTRNCGKVVTRAEIMEEVWNNETNPFTNSIEAHIRNLRKKLEKGSGRKIIHTYPGRGYKVDRAK